MKIFQIRVSGIVFIDKRLLLVEHTKNEKSYWVFPGGRVEYGEKATDAIKRELMEELELKVEVKRFLFYNESLPPEYPRHSLNLFFLLKPLTDKIVLHPDNVLTGYRLFNKNELNNLSLFPRINEKLLKNFDKWLKEAIS